MSLPDLIRGELGGEDPVARVHLGGDDELFVTPTRTLIYRAEGLLSDESVEEYAHDAERVAVSESRRKAKFTLEYGLDGSQSFAVPRSKIDEVLHPVLAGVLAASGITEPGETVERTFRFSELTLVVTSTRIAKHVGAAVWDDDYEEFHYDDVTDLEVEQGSHATTLVLTANGRQERFKAPNDRSREIEETLTTALLAYYDVDSLSAFRALSAEAEGDGEADDADAAAAVDRTDFGDGPDPLSADPSEVEEHNGTRTDPLAAGEDADVNAETEASTVHASQTDTSDEPAVAAERVDDDAFGDTGFEPAEPTDDLAEEVVALREAVERQNDRLDDQRELIEQLIEELRRGR